MERTSSLTIGAFAELLATVVGRRKADETVESSRLYAKDWFLSDRRGQAVDVM